VVCRRGIVEVLVVSEKNIALLVSFDGTAYHGWQSQRNAVSVCDTLRMAIERTVGHPVKLHGCGRTDAGVHARRYVANFRSGTRIPADKLPFALNTRLPEDIAVHDAAEVSWDFHAIQSATAKEYTYYLYGGPHRRPLYHNRALHYPRTVRPEAVAAMQAFVGRRDFACVRSMGTDVKSTVRTLYAFEVTERDGLTAVRMKADGFLYNMARALVGTLLYCGEGKITDVPALLESGERTLAGPTVPPYGLYMTGVWYAGEPSLEIWENGGERSL
jgi:tRNA pseudouridine38-40 synthase